MKLVAGIGKLPGTVSTVRNGGNSPPSPVARTWNSRVAPDRSRSRCSPRSIISTPSTSPAVSASTNTCPPWPAAITRAVRFSTAPK